VAEFLDLAPHPPPLAVSSTLRPTVLQFGAGNIGRGFMGHLFTEAGFEVVFADVVPEVIAALNERGAYPLRLAGPDRFETLTIGPVRAVDARDTDAIARELGTCAFACTAVGVAALPHLVPPLAAGIKGREPPLDVILCENQLNCSSLLRGLLEPHVPAEKLAQVGLIESVVSRMVPLMDEVERARDPLLVVAEDYHRLPVDRAGFVGEIPHVPALVPASPFIAYVERKLYVHNLGHAVAAYLGYLRGCATIPEAMSVAEVCEIVEGAMEEGCEALARKHGSDRSELRSYSADLLRRFRNAALGDTVLRVGRDPVRKLRPDDRLTGAALTCLDWDVNPVNIVLGIAAALRFDPPGDPGAEAVQTVMRNEGPGQALLQFTGQRPDSDLGRRVMDALDG
jgi:mannitol-1-phosphate 5-dehydrogenase